jgi:hypothetical protein
MSRLEEVLFLFILYMKAAFMLMREGTRREESSD